MHDITPPVSSRIKVWPGDTPFSRKILADMRKGASYTLSTLKSTVHLGAHADAPSHYSPKGQTIDKRPLDFYVGPCQVVRVKVGRRGVVMPEHIAGFIKAERVLFHTGTFPDPQTFNRDFAALSPQLIDWLKVRKVKLVGIDTPSVDPFSSKDLPAHNRLLRHDMANLEGLVLDAVPEGVYELIALPLKLEGFDASPVRAILRDDR
ncbi:MAG: cyclase family protein [Elusimicrobia bacterium]|nr:cyclase family protein [Elusimicrobiota bacterium]